MKSLERVVFVHLKLKTLRKVTIKFVYTKYIKYMSIFLYVFIYDLYDIFLYVVMSIW